MSDESNQAAVPSDDGGRCKRQSGIFHTAKREGSGKHQQVVAFPSVLSVEILCRDQQFLHFSKFIRSSINQFRHGINACMRSYTSKFDIANGQCEKVGRDGLIHHKIVVTVQCLFGRVCGTHHGHGPCRHIYMGFVCEANAG